MYIHMICRAKKTKQQKTTPKKRRRHARHTVRPPSLPPRPKGTPACRRLEQRTACAAPQGLGLPGRFLVTKPARKRPARKPPRLGWKGEASPSA